MPATRPTSPPLRLPDRVTSLDGLRGVASVVVLVHHALLTVPFLARGYYTDLAPVPPHSAAWWLTYTPLHLAWAGTEAVYLFFVLSGLVLVLPVLRRPRFDWVAFFPRRIVRIYGPAAAALLIGVSLMLLVPRFNDHTLGHWMNERPNHLSLSDLLSDLTLVDGSSGIVSPLWSLQWEMLFSAFLPAFVALAVVGRRRPVISTLVVTATLAVGSVFDVAPMFYLSLFAFGALLVVHWDGVRLQAQRMSRRCVTWPAIVGLALLGITVTWWSQGLGLSMERATMMRWLAVPAVVVVLIASAFWGPLVRLLDRRLLQWLGRISFSLYLVHEPIVVATRFVLVRVHAPTWASIAVAIPVAVGTAVLFQRFVEAPFHGLARRVGRAVETASRDLLQPVGAPVRTITPRPATMPLPVVTLGARRERTLA